MPGLTEFMFLIRLPIVDFPCTIELQEDAFYAGAAAIACTSPCRDGEQYGVHITWLSV
ncbi:hypothetical protein ACJX0J_032071, partial [Zea mays]